MKARPLIVRPRQGSERAMRKLDLLGSYRFKSIRWKDIELLSHLRKRRANLTISDLVTKSFHSSNHEEHRRRLFSHYSPYHKEQGVRISRVGKALIQTPELGKVDLPGTEVSKSVCRKILNGAPEYSGDILYTRPQVLAGAMSTRCSSVSNFAIKCREISDNPGMSSPIFSWLS